MKNYFTLTLIFLSVTIHAQKSSIDFIGGIEHSFRNLNAESDDSDLEAIINVRKQEKGKGNFRIGFNYNFRLAPGFYLKSGARFASIGYTVKSSDNLQWPSEAQNGEWVPDPSLPHSIKWVEDHYFIEIPFSGRMEFGEKKLSPFIEAGIMPHIYVSSVRAIKLGSDVDITSYQESHPGFNKLNFAANVSAGLNYDVAESWQVFSQAIYRYHLTKTYSTPVREHLYNMGIEIGLRRIFN